MADLNNRETVDRDDVIDTIEKLIEICRDGQNGFKDASAHVKNTELKTYFNQQSLERGQFAGELENELIHLGKHDPKREGSATAGLQRGWINLKASLGGGDESILSSAEAGDDNAKKHYEEALQKHLPADLRTIIERQAASVRAAHDHVRDLRDRRKAA